MPVKNEGKKTSEDLQFCQQYLQILEKNYSQLNLTRILELEDFYQKQFLDSVFPLGCFADWFLESKQVFDVGCGGGFPLLPLAFRLPQKKIIGLDARGKKVKAVSEIASLMKLKNVKVEHQRFEKIIFPENSLILFKAVGEMNGLLKQLRGVAMSRVIFYKGPSFASELPLRDPRAAWVRSGFINADKREAGASLMTRRYLGFEIWF